MSNVNSEGTYLRDPDPADEQTQANTDNSNHPIRLVVVGAIEPENESKNNAAKVAERSCQPSNDSVICGMNVRDNGEIGAITSIGEDG